MLSPVLKTSVSVALLYSDITISIIMHIRSLRVMFCANVPYVSQWPNIFLPQTVAPTVLYKYILLSVLLSQC